MTLKNVISLCWEKNKKNKRGIAVIMAAGLLMMSVLPVSASSTESGESDVLDVVDDSNVIHNEEQIDPATGEPVTEDVSDMSVITVSSDSYYDRESNMFVYQLDDTGTNTVSCTVVDGMFTNGIVSAEGSEGVVLKLYKNGYALKDADMSDIEDPGYYVIMISTSGQTNSASLAFRIIEKYTNVDSYDMPTGFSVQNVLKNGELVDSEYDSVSLSDEGDYQITYTCDSTEMSYTLLASVDHTAPTLALPQVNEQGYAKSAVDISDREENSVIYCTHDGETCSVGKSLTQIGYYDLIIQDQAGNRSEYTFTIRMYFTVSFVILLLLLISGIVALIVYVIVTRKTLRVR